jgi:integrase
VIKQKVNALLNRTEDPREALDLAFQRQIQTVQEVRRYVANVLTSEKRLELAIDLLRAYRKEQLQRRLLLGPDYGSHDMVFASATGSPLIACNVQRAFKLALGRADLPSTVRFHDVRHAAATVLLQAGVHAKVVSERLGHSTITLTLDTYSHVIPGLDADAANRLAALLAPASAIPASSATDSF